MYRALRRLTSLNRHFSTMSYNATYHVGTGAVLDYASGYMSQKFGPEVINYFSGMSQLHLYLNHQFLAAQSDS
jgi:hypothetical protein